MLDFSNTALDNMLSFYWFTHRGGVRYWLIGTQTYSTRSIDTIDLYKVSGTGFGADFDSGEISQQQWGTIRFASCSSGSAAWSHDGSLGSGAFDLSRIALELDGVACD